MMRERKVCRAATAVHQNQNSRRAPVVRGKVIRVPPGRGVLPHAWAGSWTTCVTCQSAGSFFVAHRLFDCGVTSAEVSVSEDGSVSHIVGCTVIWSVRM
jgi:hypothetical protein